MSGQVEVLNAVPINPLQLEQAKRRAKKIVNKRSLLAAGASAVPIPGLDLAVDVGVMTKMVDEINQEFGLSQEQVMRLTPAKQAFIYKSAMAVGSTLIGKLITKDLVIAVLKAVGVRLTAKQAAKVVPIAGQVVSAAISYSALAYLGRQHIEQCTAVAQQLAELPGPETVQG